MTPEQLKALQYLVRAYREEHDFRGDPDPSSTLDMLRDAEEGIARLVLDQNEWQPPEPDPEAPTVEYDEVPF